MRYRRQLAPLLSALVLLGLTLPLAANGTSFWTVATAADLLKGTSDGVYVSLSGVVTPGPTLANLLSTTPAQVWSVARGSDGTVWAGTGGDGRVIRLRAGQPEETVYDTAEANVFAVAVSGNRVFAASSPDGKVYLLEGDQPARVFFDPTETYIWALAIDASGRLWVGAGNPAVIYRVAADGTSQVVTRPAAAHVVSLAVDAEGRMLAGTESPGRLYRIGADDQPFALLDTGLAELRAVSVAEGNVIYAAGIAKGEESSGSETTSVAVTLAATATTGEAASTSGDGPTRRSVIYRIEADGTWEEIWSTADLVYDLAAQSDGGVLAATGPDGRLYRISEGLDVFLYTGVDARQITRFASTGREVTAFATANPGRVVAIGPGQQSPARYTSSVLDTTTVATWGTLRWNGTAGVELFTRSGNTERPDASWSDWAGPYRQSTGESVSSPTARFIQWRAILTRTADAPAPALSSVTLAYLPRNNRPTVTSITLYPPGVVFQRPFVNDESAIAGLDDLAIEARRPTGEDPPAAPSLNRRMMQKGLQTIAWKGEDDDDDQLLYTLQYRRDGTETWHDLRTGLTGTIFVWDTASVPDGRYFIRVRASDAPSNAGDRALIGARESTPLDVDNTPPAVEVTAPAGVAALSLVARDGQSAIARLEYSVNGGAWRLVYPVDGLADSPEERYEIALPDGITPANVVIRVVDRLQNTTTRPAGPQSR